MIRGLLLRVAILLSLLLGVNYIAWRWLASVNWDAWWIAVPLVVAETYSLIDTFFFGLTMWRMKERGIPDPPADATVDVFITTYNEPVPLVLATAVAAREIRYPHRTWILDDGARPEMREAAAEAGVGYITRSENWKDRPRHAKAGNLNNALVQTDGEFLLILDADQVPDPDILTRTLGHFEDERVALVQTPQYFGNVDAADVLGSQAPLFYGPIQQGKDGWNAAFFCGSNAVLRREALMQLGIAGYVEAVERSVRGTLRTAAAVVRKARRQARNLPERRALSIVARGVREAQQALEGGAPLADATWRFQQAVSAASRLLVAADVQQINAVLVSLGGGADLEERPLDDAELDRLASSDLSPLGALASVRSLAQSLDVIRAEEAEALAPLATISVTEDMATAMQLHSQGWKSVYHHEVLATGLAPEDLGTMLQQRLRWAQGTLQVMLRDNPLFKQGLSAGQRLMYFATMWSYLSGFVAIVYLVAPVVYLCFGVLPVEAWSFEFFVRFLPYFLANQLMFVLASRGTRSWRGQQYALALFPVWIRACWSAAANVLFHRPLAFVVTPKSRTEATRPPWRLVWPQVTAVVVLVIALVVGLTRFALGDADGTGVLVNIVWVVYDLVVLSIVFRAARYTGPPSKEA
ncbi:glycosyltransferase family 2 protein [Naasia sp. SYSU D00948]|uniref:glycosyltransferase family 2 protein n=1 Tax=Naasia sp. SYSU D00948 TaxID=2817379 RepID=UPI001B30C737|nr:glycosyltransferase [Naasia sp. SYSU D00948]